MVLEVGTGTGALTSLLTTGAGHVVTVEIDGHLHQLASEELESATNLTMLHQDALKSKNRIHPNVLETLEKALDSIPDSRFKLAANLPYNIATTLLIQWLGKADEFESMTLMFQREVAERITAQPGSSAYGRLSILTGWIADTAILFDIPPDAFVPAPKVTSSVVQIRPLAQPRHPCDRGALEEVTRLAFGQRRIAGRRSFRRG